MLNSKQIYTGENWLTCYSRLCYRRLEHRRDDRKEREEKCRWSLMKYASKHRDPGSEDAQAGGSAGKIGMKAREGGSLNRTYIYIWHKRLSGGLAVYMAAAVYYNLFGFSSGKPTLPQAASCGLSYYSIAIKWLVSSQCLVTVLIRTSVSGWQQWHQFLQASHSLMAQGSSLM